MDRVATFESAFERLLIEEGGYSDHAQDRGGPTKFGISKKSYPDLNIASLTKEDAAAIYKRDFWDDRYARLEPIVAHKLFDLSVNMGRITAMRLVQQALRTGGNRELEVDGVFGPQTLMALKLTPTKLVLRRIRAAAVRYYVAIVSADPTQKEFLNGWINRAVA